MGQPYCLWCNRSGHASTKACYEAHEAEKNRPRSNIEIAERMQQTYKVTGDIWFKRTADALEAMP
jgi:hypothetical protein